MLQAGGQHTLDRFFVEVLVNSPEEELRKNRLALLAAIQALRSARPRTIEPATSNPT